MRFNEYGADKSAVGAMNRPLRRCWSILEKCIIGIRHDFNQRKMKRLLWLLWRSPL